jgi:hypothetical protein
MFEDQVRRYDVTTQARAAQVVGLFVNRFPLLLVERGGAQVVVSTDGQVAGRAPFGASPNGRHGVMTQVEADVLDLGPASRDFTGGPMPLPAPAWSAAISSKGRVWVSLAEGTLLYRTTTGRVSALPARARYDVLQGGAEDLVAGADAHSSVVLDARGAVVDTLPWPTRWLAFPSATQWLALDARGPRVVVHRRGLRGAPSETRPLTHSAKVLALEHGGRTALTTSADGVLLVVDLELGTESPRGLAHGFQPVHGAFCRSFSEPWVLSTDGAQWRVEAL